MKIFEVISVLESVADISLQEHYDNAGLIVGDKDLDCTGILCSLDATEQVIREAIGMGCNLVVCHHPIIFGGLKKINGKNYVEKAVIAAVKHDVAVYAIHTNLDNVVHGVNGKIASLLALGAMRVLQPRPGTLKKLFTFVPAGSVEAVRNAIFTAGGGHIGNYSECSFNSPGIGTFKAGPGTSPYVGEMGKQHQESEVRIEIIFPAWIEKTVVTAMKAAHPYEEVAYDIVALNNSADSMGSGVVGDLPEPVSEREFLARLKNLFRLEVIRHTPLLKQKVKTVAVCGGAGSFLIPAAIQSGADMFVTSDIKYHEFFDANDRVVLADIGHFESEQFTIDLLVEVLERKFRNFAVLKTKVQTNPVRYYTGEQ